MQWIDKMKWLAIEFELKSVYSITRQNYKKITKGANQEEEFIYWYEKVNKMNEESLRRMYGYNPIKEWEKDGRNIELLAIRLTERYQSCVERQKLRRLLK